MAAGLGFKTFTTGEVLTAADTNGYLMQGILVFASAAARDAAITSPQEGQFAYLKDTNVTTYYTGSAWANVDTTGMTNPMTTTGDTIYSSSGSTPARLGIGTSGQVLTVAGGVPTWAAAGGGSMTQLATGSLSGASVSITSISGSYKSLKLIVNEYIPATDATALACQVNSDTASNYARQLAFGRTGGSIASPEMRLSSLVSNSSNPGYSETDFWNYTSTTQWKTVFSKNFMNSSTNQANINNPWNAWINTANAITSIQLFPVTGNFTSGSYILYGVN